GATLGSIDRVAFLAAAAGGLAGWAWRGLRLGLWRLAALGLAASVACDAALTALRLAGWEFSADFLVPLASMAIELACAALLVYLVGRLSRRAFRTAPLLSG
ncbi:MAG TPA: hypothetical protein VN747_08335, partial [Burkholderiales bacterium]|nr:hypothetical protein [Burkholderiales bacterium]